MIQLKKLNLRDNIYSLGDTGYYENSPTLEEAPTFTTLKDPSGNDYAVGLTVRVPAGKRKTFSGYLFYRLLNITENGSAIWSLLDEGTEVIQPETLTIHFNSNLPTTEGLEGTEVTVNGETQTYEGLDLLFYIPSGTEYTVEVGNIKGYKVTYNSGSYTAQEDGNNLVVITCESECIKLSSNLDDVTYLIDGTETKSDIAYVPYDATYIVTGKAREGYTVYSQTFTASQPFREVYVEYYPDTEYIINVTSNQPSYLEDIQDVKVTVNDVEYSNGEIAKVPYNQDVTVSASEVNGYKCTTNVDGTTINAYYESEVVSVTCNKTKVTLVINEEEVSYSGSAIVRKIAFDTLYSVSGKALLGYRANSLKFTAGNVSKSIEVEYKVILNGIFGIMADGTEVDNITSDCVGVIIRDTNHNVEFIIGKTFKNNIHWGYKSNYLDVPTELLPYRAVFKEKEEESYRTQIFLWYDLGYTGTANTDKIVTYAKSQSYTSSNCAAIWTNNQTLSVGGKTLKGYLPSMAECLVMKDNYSKITSGLQIIGNKIYNVDSYFGWFMSELQRSGFTWVLDWRDSSGVPRFSVFNETFSESTSYTCALPCFRLDYTI